MGFWHLFEELVFIVYNTAPKERLGIVRDVLKQRYGPTTSNIYDKIENHVLRTVAYMETMGEPEDEE